MPLRAFVAVCALSAGLAACSSSSGSQASGLTAALDLAPQDATSVLYTDWAAFGHNGNVPGPQFAGDLDSFDTLLQSDLGFRSVDAQWEADILSSGPLAGVFQFPASTDLGAIEGKLVSLGYRKTRSGGHDVLSGKLDTQRQWTIAMPVVGVDAGRHLLVAAHEQSQVDAILGGGKRFTDLPSVRSVTQHAGAGTPVGAVVAVGTSACTPLSTLGRNLAPLALAVVRAKFAALGTLTPFSADAVASDDVRGATGTAALAFPAASDARANLKARAAAPPIMNQLVSRTPDALTVTSSTVDGPVLTLALRTKNGRVLPQAMNTRALGFDLCA
jgi:hypothetical protein